MRKHNTAILLIAALSTASFSWSAPAASPDQTLAIRESDTSFQLAVPVSRLVMTIPKGGFVSEESPHSGSTGSPRYFHFVDRKRGIVVSGWFESAQSYRGFEAFWKSETDAWTKARLPTPMRMSLAKLDGWETAIYDLDIPGGYNTHIRAEWVQQGTWIDAHISVTTAESIESARELALGVLKGIQVTPAS